MITHPIKTPSQIPTVTLKEVKTRKFLRNLYTYPPKIVIKADSLKTASPVIRTRKPFTLGNEKFSNPTKHASSTIVKKTKNYQNRVFTSSFYNKETAPLQKSLEKIPVWTVLNGQKEIVLSSPSLQVNNSNPINPAIDNFCGREKGRKVNSNTKLGLFFLSREDAIRYLEGIIKTDPQDVNQAGLSLHCLGLDCAYDIIKQHHPTIDFKIVPDLRELIRLLYRNLKHDSFIFDYRQNQIHRAIRQVPILPRVGNLPLDKLSPFFSTAQNRDYYKGVPLYLIQCKEPPRTQKEILNRYLFNTYFMKIRNPLYYIDSLAALIFDPFVILTGGGHGLLMEGDIGTAGTSTELANYVFFDSDQAISFLEYYEPEVAYFTGSRRFADFNSLIRRGRIYATNLESFLEKWERSLLDKSSGMAKRRTMFDVSETNFMISHNMVDKYGNTAEDYKDGVLTTEVKQNTIYVSVPVNKPWPAKFKESLLLKYKKFQSAFNLFTRA
nr:hypothetical chloroplast RF80 [Ochrosphaera neapolitana]